MKNFCITTPIYYINGEPHIGHAYSSIAADIIARFKRLDGFKVHFSTGTDEHGIKVARSAKKANMEVEKFSDLVSQKFRDVADELNISYDDFIRTTEKRHIISAQTLWKRLKKEDVYKDAYAGWYSAQDEEYISESDLDENRRAPSGAAVEWMEEESYFFRLSAYQDKLLDWYEKNPDFIAPISRKNEVINFVKSGLRDLCISRSQFSWGIPVPVDEEINGKQGLKHVMYVWIDALTNYITSLGFPDNSENVSEMMSNCVHIVGKEIVRFHAVYWPAFLMSAGLTLPKKIFAHGWWTSEGMKMSKSLGNVVDPKDIVKRYGSDVLRYFLFREVRFGEDGDFSESSLKNRFLYDLANDLGNLVQRVLAFIQRRGGEFIADYNNIIDEDKYLLELSRNIITKIRPFIDNQDLYSALNAVWLLVNESNKYVNAMTPWKLTNSDRLNTVLTILCESIRSIAFGLSPFMPNTSRKIFDFINVKGESFEEISQNLSNQHFPEPFVLFPKEK